MKYEFVRSSVSNLPVRMGHSGIHEADTFSAMHYHDEIELLFVTRRNMTAEAGNSKILVERGDVLIINSRIPHSTKIPGGCSYFLWQFDAGKFERELWTGSDENLFKFLRRSKNPFVLIKKNENGSGELRDILFKFYELNRHREKGYESYIKGYVYILLGFMYKHDILRDAGKSYDENAVAKVRNAIAFIDAHYADDIDLDMISGKMNLNKSYFCRLFKKATGGTVTDYLNFVRVQEAKRLLVHTAEGVSKIAYDVGFSNLAYFNRLFKKLNSTTPTRYRRLRV